MENRIEVILKKIIEIENEATLIEKEIKKLESENDLELDMLVKTARHDIFNEAQMKAQSNRKIMIQKAEEDAKKYIDKGEKHCKKLDEVYALKEDSFTKEICKAILNCDIDINTRG